MSLRLPRNNRLFDSTRPRVRIRIDVPFRRVNEHPFRFGSCRDRFEDELAEGSPAVPLDLTVDRDDTLDHGIESPKRSARARSIQA